MLWVKTFHVVFMVTWFAGLLYLPRLFVYHVQCEDEAGRSRFEVMERKLFVIMTIGGLGTLGFGSYLLLGYLPGLLTQGWLHAKLLLVAVLVAHHAYCVKVIADFKAHRNRHGHRFFRVFNEIPALLLVAVTILVIVRPF